MSFARPAVKQADGVAVAVPAAVEGGILPPGLGYELSAPKKLQRAAFVSLQACGYADLIWSVIQQYFPCGSSLNQTNFFLQK